MLVPNAFGFLPPLAPSREPGVGSKKHALRNPSADLVTTMSQWQSLFGNRCHSCFYSLGQSHDVASGVRDMAHQAALGKEEANPEEVFKLQSPTESAIQSHVLVPNPETFLGRSRVCARPCRLLARDSDGCSRAPGVQGFRGLRLDSTP